MATRFFVIVLVLVNVLLFGIKLSSDSFTIPRAEASSNRIIRSDLPVISLIAELPAVALQLSASPAQCFTIGPMQSSNEIQQLKIQLAEYISGSEERISKAQVDQGFWVYMDALNSRAEALEIGNELGSMGLTDYYVIASGNIENGISLGLYADERNARNRQISLQALGFNARVEARYETVDHYWLDYQLVQGSSSPWDELRDSIPTAVQLELPCSVPPAESGPERMHASN